MTDKVQKICEAIKKRYECWREKELNSHSIESEIRMSECQHLLLILDSLQEESVNKVWHYQKKEPVNEITDKSRPIIVVYGNNSLNAAGKFRCYEDNSDAIWLSNSYEKWAFVEDLINLTNLVNWQEDHVNIWHDASKEIPTPGSNILMIRKEEEDTNYQPIAGCFNGAQERLNGRIWGYYNGFCYNEIEPPVKWAYTDDLL